MSSKRPTWDEYYREIVQVTAKRSPCSRKHVGCLLVKDNRIISTGATSLNGRPHAEYNAIKNCQIKP